MLRIEIPSTGSSALDFTKFMRLDLPRPSGGVLAEVNNNTILVFEDEPEAVDYGNDMAAYARTIKDTQSEAYLALADIISAIENDEFVQTYLQG